MAELRRRGVVVTEPRRGTRIGTGPPIGTPGASLAAPLPVPEGARDLSRGNPDPALLPALGPALARCRPPVRLYGEPPALPELVELAREQLRADGVPAEELCVVSGALDGIERVLQAHLRAGRPRGGRGSRLRRPVRPAARATASRSSRSRWTTAGCCRRRSRARSPPARARS